MAVQDFVIITFKQSYFYWLSDPDIGLSERYSFSNSITLFSQTRLVHVDVIKSCCKACHFLVHSKQHDVMSKKLMQSNLLMWSPLLRGHLS